MPRSADREMAAALAAAEAALDAAEAAMEAERSATDSLQQELLDSLDGMANDLRELAALAHRAGASGELVDRWYVAQPAAEPEAEPEPR